MGKGASYLIRAFADFDCTVGTIPEYLMQSTPGQNSLDLYQAPNSLPMHPAHAGHGQQQQHPHHHQPHRDMDDIMSDSGFNRPWDLFDRNFKPL